VQVVRQVLEAQRVRRCVAARPVGLRSRGTKLTARRDELGRACLPTRVLRGDFSSLRLKGAGPGEGDPALHPLLDCRIGLHPAPQLLLARRAKRGRTEPFPRFEADLPAVFLPRQAVRLKGVRGKLPPPGPAIVAAY
jgi:hypothetical protein